MTLSSISGKRIWLTKGSCSTQRGVCMMCLLAKYISSSSFPFFYTLLLFTVRLYENTNQKGEERNMLLDGISIFVDRNSFNDSFTHVVDDCDMEIQGNILSSTLTYVMFHK
jgi:hypothetical protein